MSASHSPVCAERDDVRHVPEKTARKLRELAECYETASFF